MKYIPASYILSEEEIKKAIINYLSDNGYDSEGYGFNVILKSERKSQNCHGIGNWDIEVFSAEAMVNKP